MGIGKVVKIITREDNIPVKLPNKPESIPAPDWPTRIPVKIPILVPVSR